MPKPVIKIKQDTIRIGVHILDLAVILVSPIAGEAASC